MKEDRRGPESLSMCETVHEWKIEPGEKYDLKLGEAIRHMVTNRHAINGYLLGGFRGDDISPKKIGIGFFQKAGLLKHLMGRFHGKVGDALDLAFSQVPEGETVEVVSDAVIPDYLSNGNKPANKTETKGLTMTDGGLTCQHHWKIETPRGPMSKGSCKRCGDEREFRNSATDHLWEDESGSGYNAWRGIKAPAVIPPAE